MSRPAIADDVFRALADPTRRALLDALHHGGELAVGDLARPFAMTLPGLSRHLKLLKDSGLVTERRHGRQRLYRLTPSPLHTVAVWLNTYQQYWDGSLRPSATTSTANPTRKDRERERRHCPRGGLPPPDREGLGGTDRSGGDHAVAPGQRCP